MTDHVPAQDRTLRAEQVESGTTDADKDEGAREARYAEAERRRIRYALSQAIERAASHRLRMFLYRGVLDGEQVWVASWDPKPATPSAEGSES